MKIIEVSIIRMDLNGFYSSLVEKRYITVAKTDEAVEAFKTQIKEEIENGDLYTKEIILNINDIEDFYNSPFDLIDFREGEITKFENPNYINI